MHDNKVPNPLLVGGSDRGYFLPPLAELPPEVSAGINSIVLAENTLARRMFGRLASLEPGSLIRRLSVRSEPLTLVTGLPVWRIQ